MSSAQRLLGATLCDGVRRSQLVALYLAAFATILLGALANLLQPYLLETFLGVDTAEQGNATGVLGFANELVIVVLVGAWGALSDRRGRRVVYTVGFVIMAVGFALMPLGQALVELVGLRALYAVGIAACTAMLATVVADYVVDADRGKANAVIGIMSGLGAMVSALVLVKLPGVLASRFDYDGRTAGWLTYGLAACFAIIAAAVVWRGLRAGAPVGAGSRVPLATMAREGARASRDPGVALSYAASFVARPDLAVAAIFIPLWLSKHHVGLLAAGASEGERVAAVARGVAEGGAIVGIIGGSALLFAPVIGVISDRIHRALAVALGLGLNTLGYGLTLLVADPTSGLMKLAAVFIGFGQVSGVIASQVLVQQQAPARVRGSVIGVFGVFGGLGIMFATWLGGRLFDGWSEQGPFALLAIMNAVVALAALALHSRVRPNAVPVGPTPALEAGVTADS